MELGKFDDKAVTVIEIDESYFLPKKHHRMRVMDGVRVFGAVERESRIR